LYRGASIKKIVILGPESTGKSSLCTQLSKHFNTNYCPEFARAFLLEHGPAYSYDDLLSIAEGQLALEDNAARSASTNQQPALFIDTDMYVMKVWCEFVFNKCHPWILNQIAERKYDLYLLCNTDLPWVKDELREYPDLQTREALFRIYKDIMINQSVPWVEISGNHDARLRDAIDAVSSMLAG
jgi:NadR type nicotinamide-nucleotide adenylyltransferase